MNKFDREFQNYQNENSKISPTRQIAEDKIYTMPKRFMIEEKKKDVTKIFMLTAIILGVIGIGIAGFVFVFKYINPSIDNQDKKENLNNNKVATEAVQEAGLPVLKTEAETETPADTEEEQAEPEKEADINIGVKVDIDDPVKNLDTTVMTGLEDEDKDGLTLNEEKLYTTNPLSADTDLDGYNDGEEVVGGYDPTMAGRTLKESGLVNIYQNPIQNYTIVLPRSWIASFKDEFAAELEIDTKLGEFIRIIVKANKNRLPIIEWVAANDLLQDASQLVLVKINNLSGYKTANGLKYYFQVLGQDLVYVLIYEAMGSERVSFATTFEMIARSFALIN